MPSPINSKPSASSTFYDRGTHIDQNFLTCDKCSKKFTSKAKLEEHIANKHKVVKQPSQPLPATRVGRPKAAAHRINGSAWGCSRPLGLIGYPGDVELAASSTASRTVGSSKPLSGTAWGSSRTLSRVEKGLGTLATVTEEPALDEQDELIEDKNIDEAEPKISVGESPMADGDSVTLGEVDSRTFPVADGDDAHDLNNRSSLPQIQTAENGIEIIFIVDSSSSMGIQDVEDTDVQNQGVRAKVNMSRIKAVRFACVEFLSNQLHSPMSGQDRYTLITFNETATTHFAGVPAKCAWQLMSGALQLPTKLGTHYLAALKEINQLISLGKFNRDSVLRIFWLSDGRPGDWTQIAVGYLQKSLDEVAAWRSLQIHTVGFGQDESEFAVLQQLALLTHGSFQVSLLGYGAVRRTMSFFGSSLTHCRMSRTCSVIKAPLGVARPIPSSFGEQERVTLGPPPWSGVATPMVEMTCMRYTPAPWPSWTFQHSSEVIVKRTLRPYSFGSFRSVFGMIHEAPSHEHGRRSVAKELRGSQSKILLPQRGYSELQIRPPDELQDEVRKHGKALWSSEVARHYAHQFEHLIADVTDFRLEFLQCHLYVVRKVKKPKVCKMQDVEFSILFAGEDHIEGAYKKWINNWDYICPDVDTSVVEAFMHFTFQRSSGVFLVADLQGCLEGHRYVLTDPQVLSHDKSWGPADTGVEGIRKLMTSHRCGPMCQRLKLASSSPSPEKPIDQSMNISNAGKGTQLGERLLVSDLFTGPQGPKRLLFVGECSLSFCTAAARMTKCEELPWIATDLRWPTVGPIAREMIQNAAWLQAHGVHVEPNPVDATSLDKSFPWYRDSNWLEAVIWAMPYPSAYSPKCAHPDAAVTQEMLRVVERFATSAMKILRPGGHVIIILNSKQHLQWGLRKMSISDREGRYVPWVQLYDIKQVNEFGYRPRFGDHRDDEDRVATYHLSSEIVVVQWRRGDLLIPSGISDTRITARA